MNPELNFEAMSFETHSDHGEEFEEFQELDPDLGEFESEEEFGRRFPSRRPGLPSRPLRATARRSRKPAAPGPGRPKKAPVRPPRYSVIGPPWPSGIVREPYGIVSQPYSVEPAPSGSEHIRWVQSALNDVLGLRLPVDGIMDAATRSAVRSFQQREGLPVDGIVGPDSERALIAARGGQSPQARGTKPAEPGMTEPAEPATTPPEPGMTEPAEPAMTPPAAEFDFEWETVGDEFKDAQDIDEADLEWLDSEWEETLKSKVTPPAGAVHANRFLARQIGWGCIRAGRVEPIDGVLRLLGLGAGGSEEDLANAVARFQEQQLRTRGDGRLDAPVWGALLGRGVLPARPRFKPERWPVYFGGKQLGAIEKTRPYAKTSSTTHGSVEIELGFRVTDMDVARRAGFVDASGEDNFRWMQIIELRRIGVADPDAVLRRIKRYGRIIDPTLALDPAVDIHPYYWDEVTPPGIDPGLHVSNFRDRPAHNGLCYDWIFYDRPNIPFTAATPGRRAYLNFETALVGVRTRHDKRRNVILNTVRWGFDILVQGAKHEVRLNALSAGPRGGSVEFRQFLARLINEGQFSGHCFVGEGFTGKARCR